MYVSIRKFKLKSSETEVREAVMTSLVPLLKNSPGFQAHWLIKCTDGDIAGVSIFDTESNLSAATERTLAWVNAHIRELVLLPPEAMFSGEAQQVA